MTYHYAQAPADVLTDPAGNVVPGWRLDVYDSATGGVRVTDVTSPDGTTLPGYLTTDDRGRYQFARTSESLPVLWLDDGQTGQRWAAVAVEARTAAATSAQDVADAQASAQAAQQSAADAESAAQQATGANATAQAAYDEIDAYKVQTPTLEELLFSVPVAAYNYNGTLGASLPGAGGGALFTMLVVPIPLRILGVSLAWEYWSITANDNNYWSVKLQRAPAGGSGERLTVGERNTRASGAGANGGVTARSRWSFDGVDLSGTTFGQGDLVILNIEPVGSPPDMSLGLTATLRYTPA